jgi:hypothetical protein
MARQKYYEELAVNGPQEINDLDDIVRRTLSAFANDISVNGWSGRREREAVSLYALGYLASAVRPGSVFFDVSQIGVEVPVPQLPIDSPVHKGAKRVKTQVCKDIVIWPQPAMTCWDHDGRPTVFPKAVMLWKSANQPDSADMEWLQYYSMGRRNFVGYAVATAGYGDSIRLQCARVAVGRMEPNWLKLGVATADRT